MKIIAYNHPIFHFYCKFSIFHLKSYPFGHDVSEEA